MARVSIVIPSYNTSGFIDVCLRSVFAQSFSDFEVLVVNDGSPDSAELERVIEPYQGRIRYQRQENRGLAGARNTALRMAQGELVALLDSDDEWLPGFLEHQVAALSARPSLMMHWTDGYFFGGSPRDGHRLQQYNRVERPVTLERILKMESVPLTSSAVLRRQVFTQLGEFDDLGKRAFGAEDFLLWCRMAQAGMEMDRSTEPLVRYRLRADSLSANGLRQTSAADAVYQGVAESLDKADPLQAVIARCRRDLWKSYRWESARRHLQSGRAEDAAGELQQLTRQYPDPKAALIAGALRMAPAAMLSLFRLYRSGRAR